MTHTHQITDAALAKQFLFATKAKLTLVSKKTGQRFTYKVSQRIGDDGSKSPFFVSVLNGPDNWDNYQYIGFLPIPNGMTDGANLVAGRKGRPGAPSFKAFDWFYKRLVIRNEIPESLELWHEGQCGACGRALTVPASIATGFGPHCAAKLGIELIDPSDDMSDEDAAALTAHETQAEKAWLVHAERPDPEAQADLDLHDELNDSVDDLYAAAADDCPDEGVPELPGAGRYAINF